MLIITFLDKCRNENVCQSLFFVDQINENKQGLHSFYHKIHLHSIFYNIRCYQQLATIIRNYSNPQNIKTTKCRPKQTFEIKDYENSTIARKCYYFPGRWMSFSQEKLFLDDIRAIHISSEVFLMLSNG